MAQIYDRNGKRIHVTFNIRMALAFTNTGCLVLLQGGK